MIGFGWLGQAHSRSMLRIPTLFAERDFDPELVVCSDTVPGAVERGGRLVRLRPRGRRLARGRSTTRPSTSSSIAAPNMLHLELVEAAAQAGKHVFCEKPVGGTPEQTVARRAGRARTPA